MRFGLVVGLSLVSWVALAGRQLNVAGFAACLTSAAGAVSEVDLDRMVERYDFHPGDGILPYLATYPGTRLPGLSHLIQDPARRRWSQRWESLELALARSLVRTAREERFLTPGHFFALGHSLCEAGDVFCAALLAHNVLRTLGRYGRGTHRSHLTGWVADYNPSWFRGARAEWIAEVPRLQAALIPLRVDGRGDRWGEWYHVFGILTFALHEAAVGAPRASVEFASRMNALLNPLLAGGPEEPEKAQIDRDSVEVARRYISGRFNAIAPDCSARSAYVSLSR